MIRLEPYSPRLMIRTGAGALFPPDKVCQDDIGAEASRREQAIAQSIHVRRGVCQAGVEWAGNKEEIIEDLFPGGRRHAAKSTGSDAAWTASVSVSCAEARVSGRLSA